MSSAFIGRRPDTAHAAMLMRTPITKLIGQRPGLGPLGLTYLTITGKNQDQDYLSLTSPYDKDKDYNHCTYFSTCVTWRLEVKIHGSSRLIAADTSQGHPHQTDAHLGQLNTYTVRQTDRQTAETRRRLKFNVLRYSVSDWRSDVL